MSLDSKFSMEVTRAVFFGVNGLRAVTLPIVGAMCAMRRADFSRRGGTAKRESEISQIGLPRPGIGYSC